MRQADELVSEFFLSHCLNGHNRYVVFHDGC